MEGGEGERWHAQSEEEGERGWEEEGREEDRKNR